MNNNLPVIILKDLVLFPQQEVRIDLNNTNSKNTINKASKDFDDEILVVCPKDNGDNEEIDLPNVGVIGTIKSKMELPNGIIRITIKGIKRVAILKYLNDVEDINILSANYMEADIPKYNQLEETAYVRKLKNAINNYIDSNPQVSNSIISTVKRVDSINLLTDIIATFIPLKTSKKLDYMQELNGLKRAMSLLKDLTFEMDLIALDQRLDDSLREKLDESQRDYILKEKLNELKKELGDTDEKDKEVANYYDLLDNLHTRDKIHDTIVTEIKKFDNANEMSPEVTSIRNYLDWVLNLPWNTKSTIETNLVKVRKSLDKSHYGLNEIKDRIIEDVALRKNNANANSPIICLVGPPGVGKTTIAKSIAIALNKKFFKISLGGMADSTELNGHRRTYLGSAPGKIIKALKMCCTNNPVILLDEVDKLCCDNKGDPASVLLDVLDPEQNEHFTDNYIDMPFDLRDVTFILTANDIYNIPGPLLDRLEITELNSYTEFEKIDIAKKYLLPKILTTYNVSNKDFKITDEAMKHIIKNYSKEAGVRELNRLLDSIVRKYITENIDNKEFNKISLSVSNLTHYLGNPRYMDNLNTTNPPGVVNLLAYTPFGGEVTRIESCSYLGTGNIISTGRLGDVLNESISVALTYLRSNQKHLGISKWNFNNQDIHLHLLEGAVKKDGPSAGVNIVTSILSLILNKPIDHTCAFTGEIGLNGDIYKVGGIKEKIIGAYNNGIKKVYIPISNAADLSVVPEKILKNMTIITVKNYLEIYNQVFKQK